MKVVLVSLNQVWENKEVNLILCDEYLQKAFDEKADLIIFPEMTLTGFSTNIEAIVEDERESITIKNFSKLSNKYGIAIVFGMVVKNEKKALNKAIFIDSNGAIIGNYSKIHPFSFAGEDMYFNSGRKLAVVSFQGLNIGLTICYDLRFPELYSTLAKKCDLILNIANWPSKRVNHWEILLQARAIENQVFMVGANRTGIDGNSLEYVESSNVFNANGEKLEYKQMENMKIYEIDKNWTMGFKAKFNTTHDRKIEFYKEIL